jgi:hypothetical protein
MVGVVEIQRGPGIHSGKLRLLSVRDDELL